MRAGDPRWLVVAFGVTGCGEFFEPPWRLEEPQVLAIRVDVVEEGPASVGLIPIPADRVRHEPLPGDTIEARPYIADATGLMDPEPLDLQWFVCSSTDGPCLSRLRQEDAGGPCGDASPEESICRLDDGPSVRWRIPDFDPEQALAPQIAHRIVVVGGLDGRATADCVDELGRDVYVDLGDCVMAYVPLWRGPVGALLPLAAAAGVELGENLPPPDALDPAGAQPDFHAEVEEIALVEVGDARVLHFRPGEPMRLYADSAYAVQSVGDPRDDQLRPTLFEFDDQIFLATDREFRAARWFTTAPGELAEPFSVQLPTIVTGAPGDDFSLFVVLSASEGSQALAIFDVEVVAR